MAWNRPSKDSETETALRRTGTVRPTVAVRGVVAGVIVVLGAAVAMCFLWPGGDDVAAVGQDRHSLIKEVKPEKKAPRARVETRTEGNTRTLTKAESEEVRLAVEESRQAEERKRKHEEMWAKKLKTDKRLQAYLKNFKPVENDFKSSTEQFIDWICTTQVGDQPPLPMPALSPFELEHIDEVLNAVNEIKEGDDEWLAERKRAVDAAKKELKDYLASGGTVQEFFDYYRKELQKAWETKQAARKSVREVMAEGDNEISREYLRKVNKLLNVQGNTPIELNEEERKAIEQ